MARRLFHAPIRLTAGAFILNSGLTKWSADAETAAGMQGMAAGTYPALGKLEPLTFAKVLSATEIAVGAALLTPTVGPVKSGALLTAFSGGLLGLYVKTPGMHEGLRPTQQGTAIAKDIWLLGMGTSLVLDGLANNTKKAAKRTTKATKKAAKKAANAVTPS
jgi:hypothetical protein